MANEVFNVAKGRVNELLRRIVANDPTNSALVVVLLKVAEADATLRDYDTLSALLAGSNTEADFTNYARKVLTDADLANPTVDDTGDTQWSDMGDQTWTSAGGAANNSLVKLVICYDNDSTSGDDTNLIPLTHHDFVVTTDGSNLVAQVAATGFYSAA